MRSRLAITALLATGALMSSGGAALGVSALSTDLSASAAQYGTPPPAAQATPPAGQAVLGAQTGNSAAAGPQDSSGVLGATAEGTTAAAGPNAGVAGESTSSSAPTAIAQPARQVSASQADQLPFTGYAAIPMLLIGLALLGAGVVLRRGTRRSPQQL